MTRLALDAAARAFLERERVGRLATADASGAPHIVPVCYALSDGARVHIAIDEKPKRGDPRRLKRLRNIASDPRVMLLVDRYDEDWSRLAWVALRGRAEIVEGGAEEHMAALAALRARYEPYRAMNLEALPVIAIQVRSAASWGRLTPV